MAVGEIAGAEGAVAVWAKAFEGMQCALVAADDIGIGVVQDFDAGSFGDCLARADLDPGHMMRG